MAKYMISFVNYTCPLIRPYRVSLPWSLRTLKHCRLRCSAQSTAAYNVNAALDAAEQIGYPVNLRSASTLGGLGSCFANNLDELRDLSAKSLSLSPHVLIERSMKSWKELEYEVLSAYALRTRSFAAIWRISILSAHTGDSIGVAPSQTLPDDEYHMLHSAAIKVIRHLGVVSECSH
ncbi:carbamoyl-phosphate synthase L chain, ATP binding domain-containing protein [Suillus subalutaceus]|uniref:carbamoyl-phosphate synthase L chain, ATP binding domain-containing protein n=1 Tax=Suillus subalutaceus TaxID=48586 RepID=UPI001B871D80|nr:carbamoyl-phosphate synthase L chain, ATP binding domain-containing protein [Suillus subalutaceus]KAG1852757.1 carbamoyl-phosphate synthase L chain, ATP binding domain-containing protein [Suillus subalutaceus]